MIHVPRLYDNVVFCTHTPTRSIIRDYSIVSSGHSFCVNGCYLPEEAVQGYGLMTGEVGGNGRMAVGGCEQK